MKINWNWSKILVVILIVLLIICGIYINVINNNTIKKIEEIEYSNEKQGNYTKLYYENTLKELKNENKALYDSIKNQKNEIDYLVQFKYRKNYVMDTVFIEREINNDSTNENIVDSLINVYSYKNEINDTLNYELKIGSIAEPNWYQINLSISDEFTIINKNYGDLNRIDIDASNNSEISDVIVINPKKKYNPLNQLSIGPSITGGYDVINKQWGLMVGVSVVYNVIPNNK